MLASESPDHGIARRVVAVESADKAKEIFYVFCDDGTVWKWVTPHARGQRTGSSEGWDPLYPALPQD